MPTNVVQTRFPVPKKNDNTTGVSCFELALEEKRTRSSQSMQTDSSLFSRLRHRFHPDPRKYQVLRYLRDRRYNRELGPRCHCLVKKDTETSAKNANGRRTIEVTATDKPIRPAPAMRCMS